jgi:protocatechuate 3,4-dioxygenase beta subunit
MKTALIAAAFLASAPAVFSQSAIEGAVVDSRTGRPAPRTQVALLGNRRTAIATSDAGGNFKFTGIEPGPYQLVPVRGKIAGQAPSLAAAGEPVAVALERGQALGGIVLKVIPQAAVEGRVLDEAGNPLEHARVEAFRPGYAAGEYAMIPAGAVVYTDDRGRYRLYDLDPGRYFLRATYPAPPSSGRAYAPIYFHDALSPSDAAQIELGPGDERTGADFRMRIVGAFAVRGRVTGCDPARARVALAGAAPRTAPVDREGNFIFEAVTPGAYTVEAACASRQGLRGSTPVTVDGAGEVDGIEVRVQPPADIHGRVRIEGMNGGGVSYQGLRVALLAGDAVAAAEVDSGGSFTFPDVPAGTYDVAVNEPLPGNFYVQSITFGGVEVLEHGFRPSDGGTLEIVLSPSGGSVRGTVLDGASPAANAPVVLVPDEARRARGDLYRVTGAGLDGRFLFGNLPPGRYTVFAWSNVVRLDPHAWRNPEVLDEYAGQGRSVSIGENGAVSVEVPLIRVP